VHVMGGDFNAHVDHVAGEGVNEAGNNLVELAGNCALSFRLVTSRENPTFHTHRGDIELRSCPDHVLGSVDLHRTGYQVLSVVRSDVAGSDHYPVEVTMSFWEG
jgi:endonuclease/exonuclease/phosphatase family metal-dependent hydrolase